MGLNEILCIVLLALSGITLIISVLQFLRIGKPLHSQYRGGDPKPYFKVSGVIFALLTGVNLANAAGVWLKKGWICSLAYPLIAAAVIYAIQTSKKLD